MPQARRSRYPSSKPRNREDTVKSRSNDPLRLSNSHRGILRTSGPIAGAPTNTDSKYLCTLTTATGTGVNKDFTVRSAIRTATSQETQVHLPTQRRYRNKVDTQQATDPTMTNKRKGQYYRGGTFPATALVGGRGNQQGRGGGGGPTGRGIYSIYFLDKLPNCPRGTFDDAGHSRTKILQAC